MATQWQRIEQFVATDVDGSRVLFCIPTGQYVALNDTAQRIWELLQTPMEQPEIVAALEQAFEVDHAVCEDAVARTVDRLAAARLVVAITG